MTRLLWFYLVPAVGMVLWLGVSIPGFMWLFGLWSPRSRSGDITQLGLWKFICIYGMLWLGMSLFVFSTLHDYFGWRVSGDPSLRLSIATIVLSLVASLCGGGVGAWILWVFSDDFGAHRSKS